MKTYRYLVLLLLATSCLLSACSDQALNDAVEQPQNTATDIRDDNTDQPPANTDNIEAGVTTQTIPDNINGNTPLPAEEQQISTDNELTANEETEMINLQITISSNSFSAILYNNTTTEALIAQMPLTLTMSELNGNEKYFYLDSALPITSEQVGEIYAGELMLYGDDCLVLFYQSFSTPYSYTRLGYLTDTNGLKEAVGNGSIEVSFSLE